MRRPSPPSRTPPTNCPSTCSGGSWHLSSAVLRSPRRCPTWNGLFARGARPGAVTTTVFPILLRSWTTKSRLVPPPTGSGRDDPLRARRRRRSDPAERLLRRGRIRPRDGTADAHRRVAAPGQPTRTRRAPHHVRSTAVHRRDATWRDAHFTGYRCARRGGAVATLRQSDFDGAR